MPDIKTTERSNSVVTSTDDDVIDTFNALKEEAKRERDLFTQDWKNIEDQVNCVHPDAWDDKEDWQTRVYMPLQIKGKESAKAIMETMIIGQRRFYGFIGIDTKDKEKQTDLGRFIDIILERGKFSLNNSSCFSDAVEKGTCFLKIIKEQDKPMIHFSRRSVKSSLFDPRAVLDWDDARYYIEEHNLDIREVMADKRFTNKGKDNLLAFLHGKSGGERGDHIQMYSSEGDVQYRISKKYQEVGLDEFWGYLPQKSEKVINGKIIPFMESKLVYLVIAENHVILHNSPSETDFIPVQRGRMKRKDDHGYGNGFLKTGIGVQDLANNMVCLGMDSAKISSLPMVVFETDAIVDPSSVDIRPMAKLELKNGKFGAYQIHRFNVNAMPEVTAQLALLDQFYQEASGVSRSAEGTEQDFGKDETLGQTEIKLRGTERRMLSVAKDFTDDYILPTLRKVFKIITDKKYRKEFQKLADDTIGFKDLPITDAETGQEIGRAKERRVNLEKLGTIDVDFKPLGLINFVQKTEVLRKLDLILQRIEAIPELKQKFKVEEIFKAALDMSDVPDYQEFEKSTEEIQAEQQRALAQLQSLQAQPQQGADGQIEQLPQQGGAAI